MNDKVIYKTSSFLAYALPVLYLGGTVAAYLLQAHVFVIAFCGLVTLTSAFRDHVEITVFEDRLQIRYADITGPLLAKDHVFYYSEIESFSVEGERWRASFWQLVIIFVAENFLPGRRLRTHSDPKTTVRITTKKITGESGETELVLNTDRGDILRALELARERFSAVRKTRKR